MKIEKSIIFIDNFFDHPRSDKVFFKKTYSRIAKEKFMDNFSLETVKIAKIQADLCDVKKENTVLKDKVSSLEHEMANLQEENAVFNSEDVVFKSENAALKSEIAALRSETNTLKDELKTLNDEVKTLSSENVVLRDLNKTVLEKVSKINQENKVQKSNVDTLQNDVDILKSTVGQSINEKESDVAAAIKEPAGTEANLTVSTNDTQEDVNLAGSNIGKRPKAQKKREQNETFRNWRNVMTQRNKPEELWASGLIKYTIEQWEDKETMDEEQILDFIKKNVEPLTAFISSESSKEKFFLTFIKICSMREVSQSKFQEIMPCFENQGPQYNRITEVDIRKFINIYKDYKG